MRQVMCASPLRCLGENSETYLSLASAEIKYIALIDQKIIGIVSTETDI
jgi:hypothetical protein